MFLWPNEFPDFDDVPEVEIEKLQEEELEVPDVHWKEDIENIEDPELKEKEIHVAEKLIEEEENLNEQLDRGKIDHMLFEQKYQDELAHKKSKTATRCGIESVGMTYNDLGDLIEEYELSSTGDIKKIEQREESQKELDRKMGRLQEAVETLGPEKAQELADRMDQDEEFEEEKSYDFISDKINRYKKGKK